MWGGDGGQLPRDDRSPEPTVSTDASEPVETTGLNEPPQRTALADEEAVGGATSVIVAVSWGSDGSLAEDVAVRWRPDSRDFFSLFERVGRTDGTGRVRFDGIQPGSFVVEVDRGEETASEVARGRTAHVQIEIPPGLELLVRVVDPDDRPIPGASIWLSYSSSVDDGALVAKAGPDGAFTMRDVQAGRLVSAEAEGFLRAPVFKIAGDATGALEVTLKLDPFPGTLSGRVLDPEGQPIENAAVLVGSTSGRRFDFMIVNNDGFRPRPARFFRTDGEGFFRMTGIPLHDPMVWARAPGFAVWRERVPMSESGVSTVEIRLQHGATVAGRILDLAGEPAPDVDIRVLHEDIEPGAMMSWQGPSWARRETRTDEEGRYFLDQLKPGTMKLRAQKGQQRVVTELTLVDGQHEFWEAFLGSGGSIHGVLTDSGGAPLSGWQVFGRPSRGQRGLPNLRNGLTDEQGLFELAGAEEGSYDVSFVLREGGLSTPLKLYGVAPGPDPLLVTMPESRLPSARFTGRVFSPDGQPLAELDVRMRRQGEDGAIEYAGGVEQVQDGTFTSKPVPPGRYSFEIRSEEFGFLYLGTWEVGASQTTDIGEHHYAEPGALEIEIVDADGVRVVNGGVVYRREGQPQGYLMSADRGVGRIENVHPGRYVLSSWGTNITGISRTFEIPGGRETKIRFEIPSGVPVKLRYPAIPRDNYVLRTVWRDRSGRLMFESGGSWNRRDEPLVMTELMPPGEYTLEVSDTSGGMETIEVTVSDTPDERIYDLPLISR